MAGFLFKKTGLRCAQLLKRSMHVEKRYYSVTSKKKKFLSHYEILGIKQSANQSEIRAAFVELSKELHPDRNPDDPTTHDKFVRLNEAYSVLSKELSRKEYDMTLAYRLYMSENLSQAHHSDSYSGPGTASGPNEGFEQERVAWDETLWHMRDKKKFTGAPDDEFYGIKGIKKQSNSVIVAAGGFLFMALGFLYFLFGLKWSNKSNRLAMEHSRKNAEFYNKVRANAARFSNKEQLENFAKKHKERTQKRNDVKVQNQVDMGSYESMLQNKPKSDGSEK